LCEIAQSGVKSVNCVYIDNTVLYYLWCV